MGTQPSEDKNLTASALAVALVALIIATAQLLGQYFATADGYRRCQPSVMGAWGKHTRLRWRWSQFRFETVFTTPEIMLLPLERPEERSNSHKLEHNRSLKWIASPETPTPACPTWQGNLLRVEEIDDCYLGPIQSRCDASSFTKGTPEVACWLPFLQSLHDCEMGVFRLGCYANLIDSKVLRRPACRFVQSSWDFMSPDLIYPLALTSVGDIAVMIERLRIKWSSFRPKDGVMRAGRSLVVYSTLVRSIGPILHFSNGRAQFDHLVKAPSLNLTQPEEVYVPSSDADMMRFGLLPIERSVLCQIEYLAM